MKTIKLFYLSVLLPASFLLTYVIPVFAKDEKVCSETNQMPPNEDRLKKSGDGDDSSKDDSLVILQPDVNNVASVARSDNEVGSLSQLEQEEGGTKGFFGVERVRLEAATESPSTKRTSKSLIHEPS